LKKHANEFEARSTELQLDKNNLEYIVREQDEEILKLKHEIRIVVQLKNEAILEKKQTHATCNYQLI
jgi:hypothetical protein